ncbi:MAG: hypothetical protein AB8F78_14735 [Saprospiraceae bacterium]
MRKTHVISLLTLFIAATTVLPACNSTAPEPGQTGATGAESAVGGFAAFYNQFHQDSLFQISRISWPLSGNYVQDSTGAAVDLRHAQADWTMHRPIIDNPDFVQEFVPLTEDLVEEVIKARVGNYKIERRFAKLDGGWHLIYYRTSTL